MSTPTRPSFEGATGLQLHLGCWHRIIPGFVNVDLCDFDHIDVKAGIDDLSAFDDASATLSYASHAFEYFDRQQAVGVLAEWARVLAPGGTLRLAVPDFDALIEVYKRTGAVERVLGPLYGRMEIDTQDGPATLYHKTVYTFDSLAKLLTENGFANARRYDWRDTIHRDHDDHSQAYFPHMDKENGLLISLNVEATRT